MIVLEDLTRTFGDVHALDDISLTVRRGEVVGLLGHNGAGKTTTVRLVAGLLAPTAGRVTVDGLDPDTDGAAVRRRLGVLPANPSVDDRLTGRDNLRFTGDLFDVPRAGLEARIDALLDQFELAGRAEERAGGYSTGMRQRLSLARVLLHDPDVLLLDEPTAALDPVAARQVRDIIAGLGERSDRTVVICTHNLAEAQRLCDRVVILEHGRIKTTGTPAELTRAAGTAAVDVEIHPDDAATAATIAAGERTPTVAGTDDVLSWPGLDRDEVPLLVRSLTDVGVRVYEVRHREPSLEDIYLDLHAEQTQEASS